MALSAAEVAVLCTPAALSYATSAFCPIAREAGANVKFRPPAAVFGFAWSLLFLALGSSWVLALRTHADVTTALCYSALSLALPLWIATYSCAGSPKYAVWVLVLCVALTAACGCSGDRASRLLLSPLLGWLIFALVMNAAEVQGGG